MLLTTPESARWRRWFFIGFIGLTLSYIGYSMNQFPHGSTHMGIFYGILGSLVILILLFFGVRKRSYRSAAGRVETWLQSHIYLGLLSFVIILFHSGFRFQDKIALTALVLLSIVVFSGLLGSVFYTILPRFLTETESNLTPEQMSEQMNQISQAMARLVSGQPPAFQSLYHAFSKKNRPGFLSGWKVMFSSPNRSRKKQQEDPGWKRLRDQAGPGQQEELDQLFVLSRQYKEIQTRLILQQHYKNLLEAWLYLHVPLSVVMLLAIVIHVAAFFYYA